MKCECAPTQICKSCIEKQENSASRFLMVAFSPVWFPVAGFFYLIGIVARVMWGGAREGWKTVEHIRDHCWSDPREWK